MYTSVMAQRTRFQYTGNVKGRKIHRVKTENGRKKSTKKKRLVAEARLLVVHGTTVDEGMKTSSDIKEKNCCKWGKKGRIQEQEAESHL